MKRISALFLFIVLTDCLLAYSGLKARRVLRDIELANHYFMVTHPLPGDSIKGRKLYPSNIWTRGVYFEGLRHAVQTHIANHSPTIAVI